LKLLGDTKSQRTKEKEKKRARSKGENGGQYRQREKGDDPGKGGEKEAACRQYGPKGKREAELKTRHRSASQSFSTNKIAKRGGVRFWGVVKQVQNSCRE